MQGGNMQLLTRRLGLASLALALCAGPTLALANNGSDVTTGAVDPVEKIYGRASGNAFWAHQDDVGVPHAVTDAYREMIQILSEPPTHTQPDRFGRGAGNPQLQS
jgi:hypothetical protein